MQDQAISANHFPASDAQFTAIAQDQCPWCRELAQRLKRTLGPVLLHQRDADDDQDEAEQASRLAPVAQPEIEHPGSQQQQEHGFAHDGQRDCPA